MTEVILLGNHLQIRYIAPNLFHFWFWFYHKMISVISNCVNVSPPRYRRHGFKVLTPRQGYVPPQLWTMDRPPCIPSFPKAFVGNSNRLTLLFLILCCKDARPKTGFYGTSTGMERIRMTCMVSSVGKLNSHISNKLSSGKKWKCHSQIHRGYHTW